MLFYGLVRAYKNCFHLERFDLGGDKPLLFANLSIWLLSYIVFIMGLTLHSCLLSACVLHLGVLMI